MRFSLLTLCVLLPAAVFSGEALEKAQGAAADLQVVVTAAVRDSHIDLTFDRAGESTIWRKFADETRWGEPLATVSGAAWSDADPPRGKVLEYRVRCAAPNTVAKEIYGYCVSGVDVDQSGWKGKVILLMADNIQTPLAPELERLTTDLLGDGWTPVPIVVPAGAGWSDNKQAPEIRAKVKAAYEQDPKNTQLLFILGHVPVPRSGSAKQPPYPPDGHCERLGAKEADSYYAEFSGEWTDAATLTEYTDDRWKTKLQGAVLPDFKNIPDDGKFDQEYIPNDVVLGFGRVDMRDLIPGGGAGEEIELLRRYLDKEHQFRRGELDAQFTSREGRRCLIRDGMLSCGSHAWSSFPAIACWRNVEFIPREDLPVGPGEDERYAAEHGPYLFYARGNGVPAQGDGGKAAFWLGFQSGVPYWGQPGNSMRKALAGANYTLGFLCMPYAIHFPLHRLAMGLPFGDIIKEGINNAHELTDPGTGYQATPSWGPEYQGQMRRVFFNLVGDPTLSLYYFRPVAELKAERKGKKVKLAWSASPDASSYHVWRAQDRSGEWTKLAAVEKGTKFSDAAAPAGKVWYMVRAVRAETTGSGTFLNAAQGIFTEVGE